MSLMKGSGLSSKVNRYDILIYFVSLVLFVDEMVFPGS